MTTLIPGGAPKRGTTTSFEALARHPDVAPSRTKELGFSADPDIVTETTPVDLAAGGARLEVLAVHGDHRDLLRRPGEPKKERS